MGNPSADPVTPDPMPAPTSEAKSNRRTIVIIVVVAVVALLLCCLLSDPARIIEAARQGWRDGMGP